MRDEDLVNSTQDNSIDAVGETTEPSKIVKENRKRNVVVLKTTLDFDLT